MGGDEWSEWQIAQMGGIAQCSRCEDPPGYLRFPFGPAQRVQAARAALALSAKTPEDVLSSISPTPMSRTDHNSARFMSLAYFGGKLPMVRDCGQDEARGNAPGWYVFGEQLLSGSKIWDNHNRSTLWDGLAAFVSGKDSTGALPPEGSVTYPDDDGWAPTEESVVEVKEVFLNSSVEPSRLATAVSKVQGFRAGDYVLIDSSPNHGLMIIGYGPAIMEGELKKISVDIGEPDGNGLLIDGGGASVYGSDSVPYVVDWNIQNDANTRAWLAANPTLKPQVIEGQLPRPFYFTRIQINPYTTLFNHTTWRFVEAVEYMKVHCEWFFAENVAGDPNAPFLVDHRDPAIVIPNRPINRGL